MKKDTQTLYDLQPGDVQEEKPHRVQKRRRSRKWLWLTLTVLVVLGVVAAAVLWDANSFDGLRRSIIYARAEKDETTTLRSASLAVAIVPIFRVSAFFFSSSLVISVTAFWAAVA